MRNLMILCFALTLVLVSCEDFDKVAGYDNGDVALGLAVNKEVYLTRGVNDGDFCDGSSLGIFVMDESLDSYNGMSYSNVRYEKDGTVWVSGKPIKLSSVKACLMAYWPYDSKVSSIHSVPVSSALQTDYMYGEPVSGLSKYNADASVRMSHAMASVKVILVKGTYANVGRVASLSLSSSDLPTRAIMDASDGSLSSLDGYGESVSVSVDADLSFTPVNFDVITIPVGGPVSLEVVLLIDGEERSVEVPDVSLLQGQMTQLALVVNDSEIVVSGVAMNDWTFQGGVYDVHLGGNTENVAFSHHINHDGTVSVSAVPVTPGCSVDVIEVKGDCVSNQYLDESTGVRTVVLSDLKEDVTLLFNGAWQTTFRQYFYIDSASVGQEIRLLGTQTVDDLNGLVEYMMIDGIQVKLSQYHLFTTSGVFCVEVDVPSDAEVLFYGGSQRHIIKAELPVSAKSIPSNAFSHSPIFEEISIPGSVRVIGTNAFRECVSLKKISWYNGLNEIKSSAFYGCGTLTELKFPGTLQSIQQNAFNRCTSLKTVNFPSGVTYVGGSAFAYCESLESAVFLSRSGDTTLLGPVFIGCPALKSLTLPSFLNRYYAICEDCPLLSTIISYDMSCPLKLTESDVAFKNLSSDGVIMVKQGSVGYETWIDDLGSGWSIQLF